MDQLLHEGLAALGLPQDGIPALKRFGELLVEKNKVMNLTAITEPADVATLHFLDSVAMLKEVDLSGKTMVDVGTGAGFPGMPLRIVCPSLRLTLLDSLNKRIDFLKEVCEDLGIQNVDCVHGRAEEFAAAHRESFDFATSRAVANFQLLSELCLPLVKVGGTFIAMKSVDSDEELKAAAKAISILAAGWKRPLTTGFPVPTCPTGWSLSKKSRKRRKNIPAHLRKSKKIRCNLSIQRCAAKILCYNIEWVYGCV